MTVTSSTRSTGPKVSCRISAKRKRLSPAARSRSSATEVADDWADRWRTFHKPLLVGDPEAGPAVWIRPPWEPERADIAEVVVDPGQAFGTGAHPTTRLCIEALIGIAGEGGPFGALTDLGCGSGVLAIAAGKLGWGPLEGCDHEVAAIDAARENARGQRRRGRVRTNRPRSRDFPNSRRPRSPT